MASLVSLALGQSGRDTDVNCAGATFLGLASPSVFGVWWLALSWKRTPY